MRVIQVIIPRRWSGAIDTDTNVAPNHADYQRKFAPIPTDRSGERDAWSYAATDRIRSRVLRLGQNVKGDGAASKFSNTHVTTGDAAPDAQLGVHR